MLFNTDAQLREAREDRIIQNLNQGLKQHLKRSRLDKESKEDDFLSNKLVSADFEGNLKEYTVLINIFHSKSS